MESVRAVEGCSGTLIRSSGGCRLVRAAHRVHVGADPSALAFSATAAGPRFTLHERLKLRGGEANTQDSFCCNKMNALRVRLNCFLQLIVPVFL